MLLMYFDQNVSGVELSLASGLYIQKDFELIPNFLEWSKDIYGCMVSEVDYVRNIQAAKEINEWVEKETKNKIKEAVSSGMKQNPMENE